MKFYFLSDRPCALKIGGIYVGMTGGAEKFMNIDPADKILCEFIPASPRYLPVSFVADEDFLPTENVREYFLPSAAAFYAHDFILSDGAMRLIKQEKYSDLVATIFVQGKVFLSLENSDGIFTYELDESFLHGEIYRREGCVIFYSGSHLAVVNAKGELQFFTPVLSCEFSSTVKAEIPAYDCMRHTFSAEWILSDRAERIKYLSSPSRPASAEIALLALAEGLLKGFDVSPYITENLSGRLGPLRNFFGDYKEAIYMGENVVGLAYQRDKNSFFVVPFVGVIVGGKVESVKEYEGEK